MDVELLKKILKKLITFANVIFNIVLSLCCFLVQSAIRDRDISVLIFSISMFIAGISALVFLKYFKRFLFGEGD
ncbi:hypothetical protein [Clostridium sp.]|uniref:hypothetical protein n=1 Tax=Clostridium sp. TaxID=1506 RepID=UPI002FC6FABD